MFICLSPGGQSMTVGAVPAERLLVGTGHGIHPFVRENAGWAPQPAMLPEEHISALLYEPTSRTLLAGTYGRAIFASTTDGEVFYSSDGGEHWRKIIRGIGPVSKSHHYRNLQSVAA